MQAVHDIKREISVPGQYRYAGPKTVVRWHVYLYIISLFQYGFNFLNKIILILIFKYHKITIAITDLSSTTAFSWSRAYF